MSSFDGIKLFVGFLMMSVGALFFFLGGTKKNNHIVETVYIYESGGGSASTGMNKALAKYDKAGVDPLIGADTPTSQYGNLLAQGAYNAIGTSTADIPGTEDGNLGCAAAVSTIFYNTTGKQLVQGQNIVLGTGQLYNSLSNDPRFVPISLNNAQPGDIVVTARSSNGAGHAGIVGNGGDIISNSSKGYQGSAPGTIQNNYTINQWQSSVTTRNPNQTMAFRYIGD